MNGTLYQESKNAPRKAYLALWFFMKSGPYLRNSVVSPKNGHPIVPGGNRSLLYLISFHFNNRAKQRQNPINSPQANTNTAIDAPKKGSTRNLEIAANGSMALLRNFVRCVSVGLSGQVLQVQTETERNAK